MNIEIVITRYSDGFFTYYKVDGIDSYLSAIRDFNKMYNQHDGDFEIQLIDSDVPHLTDSNLYDFLEIVEETKEDEEVIAFLLKWYSKEDIRRIFEDYNFYVVEATSATEAIAEYLRNVMCIDIPEHLESYIDWEQFQIDYECNGYFIKELNLEEYIIVAPF